MMIEAVNNQSSMKHLMRIVLLWQHAVQNFPPPQCWANVSPSEGFRPGRRSQVGAAACMRRLQRVQNVCSVLMRLFLRRPWRDHQQESGPKQS